ncbi:MAG: hypothetical protein AVDCRST_MAG55-2058, partial [uncultured Rubrobacteraceae bacterium]
WRGPRQARGSRPKTGRAECSNLGNTRGSTGSGRISGWTAWSSAWRGSKPRWGGPPAAGG